MGKLKLGFGGLYEQNEETQEWQKVMEIETKLNTSGFDGDGDCVALGLEEMEEEVTLSQATVQYLNAKAGLDKATHRMTLPIISAATAEEARDARNNNHEGDMPGFYEGDDGDEG